MCGCVCVGMCVSVCMRACLCVSVCVWVWLLVCVCAFFFGNLIGCFQRSSDFPEISDDPFFISVTYAFA